MSVQTQAISLSLRSPKRFFIDGQWVAPSTDAMFEVIDSATEQLFLRVPLAGPADISRAVEAARIAFDEGPWPRLSHGERADYLRRMAAGIRARQADLCEIWTRQAGMVHALGAMVLPGLAAQFEEYADLANDFEFEEVVPTSVGGPIPAGAFGLKVREPVGVVGAIIPWNAPLLLTAIKIAPALLAGCTVVLKCAPEGPGEALVIAEIAEDIGLPAGVLNVLTADRDVSESLVTDARVDKIAFTGSTAAGRRIGSLVGGRIGRCTLELGGKSPALILDDADIDSAAMALAQAETFLSGQACISLTRIIVPQARHDAMAEALAGCFSQLQVGDPFDPGTHMGPLAMRRQRDRVEAYVAKGLSEGATLVTGGRRPAHLNRGWYFEPTVFANVDNSSTIAQEEIFGPVLCVVPATDEDDAVRLANDTIYGLNASVFTNDADKARAIAARLRSGTVGQNGLRCEFNIGVGGYKQSGLGREGGREGLLSYLETKAVVLDSAPSNRKFSL